jgi:hypothetical protein
MLEKYLRLREQTGEPTTALAIFTDRVKPADSSYTESCYGTDLTLKYNAFYIPGHEIDKLREDKQPFAQVILAARMALDARDDVKLREEYAREILETTTVRGYGKESADYILKFSKNVFWLDDDKISVELKEAYEMTFEQVSLKDYSKELHGELRWQQGIEQGARIKAFESALNFLNMGLPAEQVARGTGLSLEELSELANGKTHGNLNDSQNLKGATPSASVEADKPLMEKRQIYGYGRDLMKQAGAENIPPLVDAKYDSTTEGTILGIADCADGHQYAVMRLSESQAIIHRLAPGETPPEIGTKAIMMTGTDGVSTAQRRDGGQTQTRGIKR